MITDRGSNADPLLEMTVEADNVIARDKNIYTLETATIALLFYLFLMMWKSAIKKKSWIVEYDKISVHAQYVNRGGLNDG